MARPKHPALALTDEQVGSLVMDSIVMGRLASATCDECDCEEEPHVITWKVNAAEQIGSLVKRMVEGRRLP